MNHIKKFYIIVWGLDGNEETVDNSSAEFIELAEVSHYTKREAFLLLFNSIAKQLNYYAKPKFNRNHDFMIASKTGSFTIYMDILKEAEYQEYEDKIRQGEILPNKQFVLEREEIESTKITTVIVGHIWDDDPNNGVADFADFDCVFMLDIGIGTRVTSIYTIPERLNLQLEYLRYDSRFTVRVNDNDGNQELQRFTFSNKYECWHFQIVKSRVDTLACDDVIKKNYGYVSDEEARNIVAECVQEKDLRRKANHLMLDEEQ